MERMQTATQDTRIRMDAESTREDTFSAMKVRYSIGMDSLSSDEMKLMKMVRSQLHFVI